MPMTLGQSQQVVTVEAATAQINYETHNIAGVIEHNEIQNMPAERPQLSATGRAPAGRHRR